MQELSHQAKFYYGRKARSLCPMCGSTDIESGKIQCRNCLVLLKYRNDARREQSKQLGLCTRCHTRKPKKFCTYCSRCLEQGKTYISKKNTIWYKYKITIEDRQQMLEQQNFQCAICNVEITGNGVHGPYIDHNHNTNKIRGLLCVRCNTGIGIIEQKGQDWTTKAIEYLRKNDG